MANSADFQELRSIGKVTKPEGTPSADRDGWKRPRPAEANHVEFAFNNFALEGGSKDNPATATLALWRRQTDGNVFLERTVEVSEGNTPNERVSDAAAGHWYVTVEALNAKSVKGDVFFRGIL